MAIALVMTRFLAAFLYETSPTDPWTFDGVALLLTVVAGIAALVPAGTREPPEPTCGVEDPVVAGSSTSIWLVALSVVAVTLQCESDHTRNPRKFVAPDWRAVREAKDDYWARAHHAPRSRRGVAHRRRATAPGPGAGSALAWPAARPRPRSAPRTFAWRSSSRVPVQPAALELLAALSNVLARWGRWYVFGPRR